MASGGDRTYKKVKVFIDDTEVTDTWHEIYIFQSLDSPTWSCEVHFIDGHNLIESLPILHGSKMKLVISTQEGIETDGETEFEFYIYKITDKISQNQNLESYTLKGVSKAFLLNNTIRINKRYKDTTPIDIISDIVKTSFPDNDFEVNTPCDNNINAIINNWTPFISISWLLKQTVINDRADYVFFQNSMNTYTVESLNEMYNNTSYRLNPIITYKVENTGEVNHYNIIKHNWEHVDVQQNLQNGYYKSTVASYDFFNKTYSESVYNHGDDNKDDMRVAKQWKDKLFDNSEKSVISFIPKMPSAFDGSTGYDESEKWVASRRASLQRLDSERFSAQLRGSIGTWNWLGKNIYIDLPSNNPSGNDFYSKFRRGYYLVTAIVHYLTPSMYINNFEFVKMRIEDTNE